MQTVYWNYSLEEEYLNDQFQGQYIYLRFYPDYAEGLGDFQISEEDIDNYFPAEVLTELTDQGFTLEQALCTLLNGEEYDFTELCAPLYERANEVEESRDG